MTTDRIAGLALGMIALYVLWESRALPLGSLRNPGPAFLPIALALALLGLGMLVALSGGASRPLREVDWPEARHAVAILAACAFAAWALERLGYRLTMAVTLLFLLRVVERRRLWFAVGFAVLLPALTFYLFDTLLRVPLPRGPFRL
jgi:hypothetical protein